MKVARHLLCGIAVMAAMQAPAQEAGQDGPLPVELVAAELRPMLRDLEIYGTIEAVDSVELGFRQAGRVLEVLVTEGDRVKAGDALARLDSVQQSQALNVAEASLAAARAAEEQARQAHDRATAMLSRGVGTRADRDAAVQALSEAVGMVEQAESGVDQARRAVTETVLRAPADAVVTLRDVAPGQIVGAAQPVLTLASLDGLEAVFAVAPEPDLSRVMGQEVRVKTTEGDHPPMVATVTEISPLVDPETGSVTVRTLIKAPPGGIALLGAGVQGRLRIEAAPHVALPWTALMSDHDGPAVWTVDQDDRAKLVPVRVASFSDGIVYLAEGIAPGQLVIGAGSQLIYPGREVRAAEMVR